MISLSAAKKTHISHPFSAVSPGGLIPLHSVPVCKNFWLVAEKDEEVRVAAVSQGNFVAASEILAHASKPGPRALPGIEVPVEMVGAERAIVVRQQNLRPAQGGGPVGHGGERNISVIAVGTEPGGEIAGKPELLAQPAGDEAKVATLLVDAKVSNRGAQADFGYPGRGRHEVDHAADGIGPVKRRTGAAQDFDALDGLQRHGNVHVVVAGLHVVRSPAVQEDEGLREGSAADGNIRLHAVRTALAEVNRRFQPQKINERVGQELLASNIEHTDGSV